MWKSISLFLLLSLAAFVSAGCGGGGGSGAGNLPSYIRSGATEEQRSLDALKNLAKSSMSGEDVFAMPDTDESQLDGMGSSIEQEASNPYTGVRSASPSRSNSLIRMVAAARHFTFRRATRARDELDFTTDDGWHWIGYVDSSETSTTMSVTVSATGTKAQVGTVAFNVHVTANGSQASATADITGDITTTEGHWIERANVSLNGTEEQLNWSGTDNATLDGSTTYTKSLSGTAVPVDETMEAYTFTWGGTENVVSDDGYWVKLTFHSWKMDTSMYTMPPGGMVLDSGNVTFLASDGITGSITASNGQWTGQMSSASGTPIANITGDTASREWILDYSGSVHTIYY